MDRKSAFAIGAGEGEGEIRGILGARKTKERRKREDSVLIDSSWGDRERRARVTPEEKKQGRRRGRKKKLSIGRKGGRMKGIC